MIVAKSPRNERAILLSIAMASILTSLMLLGPIGASVAVTAFMIAAIAGLNHRGGLAVAAGGMALGVTVWGFDKWLAGPIGGMWSIYQDILFTDARFDADALIAHFGRMVMHWPAWPYFAPVGVAAGGIYWAAWKTLSKNPLKAVAGDPRSLYGKPSWLERRAIRRVNRSDANSLAGTWLGISRKDRAPIKLTDGDANKHTLVLGTPGSGKTVSLLNVVESAINRELPMIYVDGKGDHALAEQVISYAKDRGRPAYLFAMNGTSCIYNPLSDGGFSAKKDRIIGLREWSEDHYRKLSESYMQTVFKVLEAVGTNVDMKTVADCMNMESLARLVKQHSKRLDDAAGLLAEIGDELDSEDQVSSLKKEVQTLARSEIGHLLDTSNISQHSSGLELRRAIDERAVVYFCLPSLEFPELARLIGKLAINDLKSAIAQQLKSVRKPRVPVYAFFDEFSIFAGDQVLNLINQGRSAGAHSFLATQSVADIGRGVSDGSDLFIRQVIGSCNSYLVHRLNDAEDVAAIAEMAGTNTRVERTAQIDVIGSTGLGSARQVQQFKIAPDSVKELPTGECIFINKNTGVADRLLMRHSAINEV